MADIVGDKWGYHSFEFPGDPNAAMACISCGQRFDPPLSEAQKEVMTLGICYSVDRTPEYRTFRFGVGRFSMKIRVR